MTTDSVAEPAADADAVTAPVPVAADPSTTINVPAPAATTTTTTTTTKRTSIVLSTQQLDDKIVKACNELILTQTSTTKKQVEYQTEYKRMVQKYSELQYVWNNKVKSKKKLSDSMSYHQSAVKKVFSSSSSSSSDTRKTGRGGNDNESDGNGNNDTLSPFLVQQLTMLCYHVHLMTRLETSVQMVHEDYRVIVNWFHETIEKEDNDTKSFERQLEMNKIQKERVNEVHSLKMIQLQLYIENSRLQMIRERLRLLQDESTISIKEEEEEENDDDDDETTEEQQDEDEGR